MTRRPPPAPRGIVNWLRTTFGLADLAVWLGYIAGLIVGRSSERFDGMWWIGNAILLAAFMLSTYLNRHRVKAP